MNLEDWRREIDSIDAKIVGLVDERAKIAREIGALKAAAGLPVIDEAREDEILRRVAERGKGVLTRAAIAGIFRAIIRESRNIQTETRAKIAGEKQVL